NSSAERLCRAACSKRLEAKGKEKEKTNPMKRAILCILFIAVGLWNSESQAISASVDPIITEAVIAAPVAEVWKVWTTKEGIESWMVAKTDIDLRIGGTWRTSYNKSSSLDDDESIRHTILAFDPLKMFSMNR